MDIWDLSIQLVAADGEGWEFTYTIADVFFVFIGSGYFSFCAAYIDHALTNNKQQFTIYFTSGCITFRFPNWKSSSSFYGARAWQGRCSNDS